LTEKRRPTHNNASYFMANFGLTFTFIDSNHNYCGQKDLASKIATKHMLPVGRHFKEHYYNMTMIIIEIIETSLRNQFINDLLSEKGAIYSQFDNFDKRIDFDVKTLRKEKSKIYFEWDNWKKAK
jgi:hypothetical protein